MPRGSGFGDGGSSSTDEKGGGFGRRTAAKRSPKKEGYTSVAQPEDKSFLDQAKRAGGSAFTFTLKALDAPRAAVDKLNDLGPKQDMPGLGKVSAGNSVPFVGQMAMLSKLRDKNPKGVPGFIRNTAVDVAQDPLTYVSFGAGAGAKAGLKAVAKHLGDDVAKDVVERGAKKALTGEARTTLVTKLAAQEGGSQKAAEKVLKKLDKGGQGGVKVAGRTVVPGKHFRPVTQPVANAAKKATGSTAGQLMIPRAAITSRFGQGVADDVGAASARARAAAGNRSSEIVDSIYKAARAAKVTTPELEDIVLPALDVGGDAVTVPTRLRPLVEHLKDVRRDFTDRQVAEGVLPNLRDTESYVPLKPTEKGLKALDLDPALTESKFGVTPTDLHAASNQGGALLPRTLMPNSSVSDVDRIIGGQLRDAGKLKGSLVEKNPLLLVGRRAAQAERSIASKKLIDEIADLNGPGGEKLLVRAVDGVTKPAGWVEGGTPELGKFYAPKEIAEEVEKVRTVVTNDDALREFQGILGHVNSLWRGWATVGSMATGLGYFARNGVGNVFSNYMAGVTSPAVYSRAAKIQATIARGGKETLSAADREVVELAEKHGVLDAGFFLSEMTNPRNQGGRLGRAAVDRKMAAGSLNPLSTENVAFRSGRALGNVIESNARLTHFIAKLAETSSADEAARSVKKFLFDYQDLAAGDIAAKKVAGFWTWQRKNLPVVISTMAKDPGKFSAVAHVHDRAAEQAPAGTYPQWAINEGMVPVGGMMVGADLPLNAAAETFDPTPQNVLNRVGGPLPGLLKTLAEEATGNQIFSGLPVKGSLPKRVLETVAPPVGKVERAPYTAYLTKDEQAPARLTTALTGLSARRLTASDKGEARRTSKKSTRGRGFGNS